MSKMEDMQSYFDEYPEALRKARASSSLTLAELARISGVPYNSICSVNAGTTKQPLLFYSAATCKALGLSLDELMGLRVPEVLTGEQQQQIYELEHENGILKSTVEHYKALGAVYKPLIFGLIGVCALLLCNDRLYLFRHSHDASRFVSVCRNVCACRPAGCRGYRGNRANGIRS